MLIDRNADNIRGNNTSESDTIRALNKQKGFKGNDSVTSSENSHSTSVAGSDTAPHTENSDNSDEALSLTKDQLKAFIQAGVAQEMKGSKSKIDTLVQELEAARNDADAAKKKADEDKASLQQRIEAEKKQKDTLAQMFSEFGYVPGEDGGDRSGGHAYIAPSSMRGGMSADDAQKEFLRILDSRDATPTAMWCSPYTGETFLQKDTSKAARFIREHRELLRDGMENLAKKNGLLRGKSSSYAGRDAATTAADIPPAFLDYLSAFVRMAHSPKFIFHQFANKRLELGKGPGDVIQVPRIAYAETGTATSDWELTPGTPITSEDQPINASSVSVTLREYGMGKNSSLRPIGIPEFVMSTSLLDLEQALQRNIGHNYNEFQDLSLRTLWLATTRVVYNKKDTVVTSAGSVAAGDGGTMTYKFLNDLYAYMCSLNIPAYMNGKYGIVLHSKALAQLKNDLAGQNQYLDKQSMEDLTNIFNAATQSDVDKISGYEGDIGNFMVFSTNAISLGAAGTPGSQTETIGGSSNVTRSSLAFGADTVCQATGLSMEIREETNSSFGRLRRYIWKSHEGFGYLDVDSAIDPNQSLRVIECRSVDIAV
ncbi:MAG: hypothetical protein WBB28_27145 [Crinalium sp.]